MNKEILTFHDNKIKKWKFYHYKNPNFWRM